MSTTVVFYFLKQSDSDGKLRLACNLANTAFNRGHKVYLNASSSEMCDVLDNLLWTFAPNSFVPHIIYDRNKQVDLERFPVVIGHSQPSDQFNDVMISLHQNVVEYAQQFQRVIEPVGSTDEDVAIAQKKISHYTALLGTEPTKHYL